jgi:hypothetical protein
MDILRLLWNNLTNELYSIYFVHYNHRYLRRFAIIHHLAVLTQQLTYISNPPILTFQGIAHHGISTTKRLLICENSLKIYN